MSSLTSVVVGSGTFSGAPGDVNELIGGSGLIDTIDGNGGDGCILGDAVTRARPSP